MFKLKTVSINFKLSSSGLNISIILGSMHGRNTWNSFSSSERMSDSFLVKNKSSFTQPNNMKAFFLMLYFKSEYSNERNDFKMILQKIFFLKKKTISDQLYSFKYYSQSIPDLFENLIGKFYYLSTLSTNLKAFPIS